MGGCSGPQRSEMKLIYILEETPYLGTLGAFEDGSGYGETKRSIIS